MKFLILPFIFFTVIFVFNNNALGQADPTIGMVGSNSGVVAVGSTIDISITLGNTGTASIPNARLRPVIDAPTSTSFEITALQTGLPAGFSIVQNTGARIIFCNTGFVIPGTSNNTIVVLKLRGVTVAPPSAVQGNIGFGNGNTTTCAAGPQVAGDVGTNNAASTFVQVVPGCALGLTASAPPIICNGGTTTITASTTGAIGPVEYSITGVSFQTGNTFTVNAGTYTITAREVNNPIACSIQTTLVVGEPAALVTPQVSIVQPSCTVSLATVTVTSATTGLTVSVDGGAYAPYPSSGYLLPTGTHTIISKNASNCTSATGSFIVNSQPPTPATPVNGTVTQPTCSISTGSITVNNLPSTSWTINPGNISGTGSSSTLNNLAAGSYSFTVTNSFGCTSAPSTAATINAVVGAPSAPTVVVSQPTCTIATGNVIITSSTANNTFSLDGGTYSAYPTGGYTGLASGNHTLILQNASGCLSPVSNFTINVQPASPAAPIVNVTQPTCTISNGIISVISPTVGLTFSFDGGAFSNYPAGGYVTSSGVHFIAVQNLSGCAPNISNNILLNPQPATPSVLSTFTPITCFGGNSIITVTATGGVLPYEYSINNGPYQLPNTFSVTAGTYSILVRDLNGCVGSIAPITIIQPSAITATAVALPVACNGGTGTITINAFGGNGSYEYSINSGAFQTSNIFSVPAGSYTAIVRSLISPACSTSVTGVINVTQPAVLVASSIAKAIANCGGTSTVEVKAAGGRTPYTGTGIFTRGPGKWTFTVTDVNGCTSNTEAIILPPGCIELKISPNPARNIITVNHSAAVNNSASFQIFSVSGSRVKVQSVSMSNFSSKIDVSALASGTYLLVFINGDERQEIKFIKTTNK